jgi:hypothetical protein
MSEIFWELLDRIQVFYPSLKDADVESKISKRNAFTEEKINNLIAKVNSPWTPLELEVKNHWQNVMNMDFMQFPNYFLYINLDNIYQAPHIVKRERRLVLCVSLLCRYYTVFYEEDYIFTQMVVSMGGSEEKMPPIYRIYFQDLIRDPSGSLKTDFKKLQSICEKHFPDHTFVDHRWIMTYKVPDMLTDTGDPELPERSIYSYLFDNLTTFVPFVLI